MSSKKVTVIEPIKQIISTSEDIPADKLRVAAYARVSTEQDEQQSSYEAQVDYYTHHIKNNPDWEFVAVFADEGISGTNTKKRSGFKQMIEKALNGKIDLILTKSISRFARNTVDTLQTVRKLKASGVEVIFEKENLHTFDPKCEMMLTIMSSLAQEESRSISENVRWGKQKGMQDGNVHFAYSHFLGYRKGEDGRPEIVEEEAKVIRDIYKMFLEGKTVRHIAQILTKRSIPTPTGKAKWPVSTVQNILTNEKYKGDALLQKTYTADFLTKQVKKNNGEVRQYLVQHSHDPIIDPETFDRVQEELRKRKTYKAKLRDCSPFSNKIICADCGGFYGHKVWHNRDNTRRYDVWYCNAKYDGGKCRSTPVIREDEIKGAFASLLEKLGEDSQEYSEEKWQRLIQSAKVFRGRFIEFTLISGMVVKICYK